MYLSFLSVVDQSSFSVQTNPSVKYLLNALNETFVVCFTQSFNFEVLFTCQTTCPLTSIFYLSGDGTS